MKTLYTDACLWEVLTEGQSVELARVFLHEREPNNWPETFASFHDGHSEADEANLLASELSNFNLAAYDALVAERLAAWAESPATYLVVHGGRWWPFQLSPANYPDAKFVYARRNCYSFVSTMLRRLGLPLDVAFKTWEQTQVILDDMAVSPNVLVVVDADFLHHEARLEAELADFLPEVQPPIDVSFQECRMGSSYVADHIRRPIAQLTTEQREALRQLILQSEVTADLDGQLLDPEV